MPLVEKQVPIEEQQMHYRFVIAIIAAITGVTLSLASPANATLQIAIDVGGTSFACADNAACDSDPTPGFLTLSNVTINGVVLSGTMFSYIALPPNNCCIQGLNQTLSINNTTNATQAIAVTLGDTNFSPRL